MDFFINKVNKIINIKTLLNKFQLLLQNIKYKNKKLI